MLSYDTPLPATSKFLHTAEHTHSRSILWTASLLNRAQNLSYTRDYKQHNPFVGANDTLFIVLFSLSDNIVWYTCFRPGVQRYLLALFASHHTKTTGAICFRLASRHTNYWAPFASRLAVQRDTQYLLAVYSFQQISNDLAPSRSDSFQDL